jgi:hypothetical protein
MSDVDFILVCIVPAFIAVCAFTAGWMVGRRSRKIDLEGQGAREAFAFLLRHELHRHREDIAHIKRDMLTLERAGIKAPDIPLGLWIEVRK